MGTLATIRKRGKLLFTGMDGYPSQTIPKILGSNLEDFKEIPYWDDFPYAWHYRIKGKTIAICYGNDRKREKTYEIGKLQKMSRKDLFKLDYTLHPAYDLDDKEYRNWMNDLIDSGRLSPTQKEALEELLAQ